VAVAHQHVNLKVGKRDVPTGLDGLNHADTPRLADPCSTDSLRSITSYSFDLTLYHTEFTRFIQIFSFDLALTND